jgi:hypothetical protein
MSAVLKPIVTAEKEPFSRELFDEILPLARKCWAESTIIKGETCAYFGEREFAIEPDFDLYNVIASHGNVIIIALRDQGQLVGYVEGFVYRSMHHKNIVAGIGDTIYLEPDYRTYAAVLAEKFEREMASLGAQIIGWPTHTNGPIYQLLKARGYVGDDIVMEKRLCVSQQA